jgi:nucleoside-diphosphate-sugar epimerase
MNNDKSKIIITGASGFIGRHFLNSYKDDFIIFAIARRSQAMANIAEHKNIRWIQLDIGDEKAVEIVTDELAKDHRIQYILHLAGFYDFNNEENSEYERTNALGTYNILKNSAKMGIKRFIYASSLTVTDFTKSDKVITEESPADADFPYAISKRKGEEYVNKFSDQFPCTIVRLAAIFSDWCEYGPLYMFITTWLSKNWNARIIGGSGNSAVPYLHVKDVNYFFINIILKSDHLSKLDILIASPDGSTTHNELYETAVKYRFGKYIKPFHMPKCLSLLGVFSLDLLGKIISRRPFERVWMIKYVDHQLKVDASKTREILDWKPVKRLHIKRRILFLIEHMRSNPYEWDYKNYEAIYKNSKPRPHLKIYEMMIRKEKDIINEIYPRFKNPAFKSYSELSEKELKERVSYVYQMLKTAVRTGDRVPMLSLGRELALNRFKQGFEVEEVLNAVELTGSEVTRMLSDCIELKHLKQRIRDEIMMTIQLVQDEIEDSFARLMGLE